MLKFLIFSFFLYVCSCSSISYETSPTVKEFIQTLRIDYEILDETYSDEYEDYLASVEHFYKKNERESKFKHYLDTIINNAQILAHAEHNSFLRYKREVGRHADINSDVFKAYQTDYLSDLRNRLNTERELKIRADLGDFIFEDLKNNYSTFLEENDISNETFPL